MKRGNKSEWIDRLSEPADGKDVDMVRRGGESTIDAFLSIMDKEVKARKDDGLKRYDQRRIYKEKQKD